MEIKRFLALAGRKKQTIFTIMLAIVALSLVLTFIQPLKYSSSSKIMVVQNFKVGSDPYVTAKSNEYLSNVLSEVILTNSFYTEVMDAGFNIDADYFSGDAREQMKTWTKSIKARPNAATGMIDIDVFHESKFQAEQISRAINYSLTLKHGLYHGSGSEVLVKVINQPLLSRWPVKPNIALNIALAFALGMFISFSYIYLLPEEEYSIKIMPKQGGSSDEDLNFDHQEHEARQEVIREEQERPELRAQEAPRHNQTRQSNFNRQNSKKYHPKNRNFHKGGDMKNIIGSSKQG